MKSQGTVRDYEKKDPSGKDRWRDAVVYQIYPRSFADASGSGIGDLEGITRRLPYLVDLGVDALWVNPFYPSPQVDAGYDVSDYCDVDPLFGSLQDFDALVETAHKSGLRVIVDVVPNHSSDRHPLFQAALTAGTNSPERDLYHFADGRGKNGELPPNNWISAFGGSSWTRITEPNGSPGQWYYHLFAPEQPDFNWENPRVLEFFDEVLRFWLDRGVDGFRIDVADALIKDTAWPDTHTGNPVIPKDADSPVHQIYRHFRSILDEYPGSTAVIETGAEDEIVALFVRRDEIHQAFNLRFLKTAWNAGDMARALEESMRAFASVGAPVTWVVDNHDTIRTVTRYERTVGVNGAYIPHMDRSRDPLLDSSTGDQWTQTERGSRSTQVGVERARAMAVAMLTLPGSAYIYAGQELGLPEVTDLPEEVLTDPVYFRSGGAHRGRDGCRVPMPWSGEEAPFDFSPPGSQATWLPQPANWKDLTVEKQEADPSSTLILYRTLLRLRREGEWGKGEFFWVSPPNTCEAEESLHFRIVPPTHSPIEVFVNFSDRIRPLPKGRVVLASAPLVTDGIPPNAAVILREEHS